LITDVDTHVEAIRHAGQSRDAYYCIMDGQDTARLLKAYGYV
jgi:hypothetical protein